MKNDEKRANTCSTCHYCGRSGGGFFAECLYRGFQINDEFNYICENYKTERELIKTMYEVFYHSEFEEEEANTTCEIRKVEFEDSTESGEVSFWMTGKYDEDISFVYDTLDEVFDMLDSKENISEINIRRPDEKIPLKADGQPMFLDWTEEELKELEDYI